MQRALILLVCLSSYPVAAAESADFSKWLGLWCSNGDEIGVLVNDDPNHISDASVGPIYIYTTQYFGDSDSYTVEGAVKPSGDKFELADGDCRLRAELKGADLIVSDNHRCEKMSGGFEERQFTRVKKQLAWIVAGQVAPTCPKTAR